MGKIFFVYAQRHLNNLRRFANGTAENIYLSSGRVPGKPLNSNQPIQEGLIQEALIQEALIQEGPIQEFARTSFSLLR